MLTYELVVWLLFRSIDSFILLVLGIWLFVRKVLPSVRHKITLERDKRAQLAQEVSDLARHAQQLDQQLVLDAQEIEGLEQQVRLWHQAIKRKQSRELAEKDDVLVRLHASDAQRAQTVYRQQQYAHAVLEAIAQAKPVLLQDTRSKRITEVALAYMANKERT